MNAGSPTKKKKKGVFQRGGSERRRAEAYRWRQARFFRMCACTRGKHGGCAAVQRVATRDLTARNDASRTFFTRPSRFTRLNNRAGSDRPIEFQARVTRCVYLQRQKKKRERKKTGAIFEFESEKNEREGVRRSLAVQQRERSLLVNDETLISTVFVCVRACVCIFFFFLSQLLTDARASSLF